MPTAPDNHDAHDCAERIRERLPRRLQELREAERLSMYALWQKCGVSRDTISRIEGGETIPGVHVLARLAWGLGVALEKFTVQIEDENHLALWNIAVEPKTGHGLGEKTGRSYSRSSVTPSPRA